MKKYFKISNYLNYFKCKLFGFMGCQETYSQTGEDLILNVLFKGKNDGFYVDIGANDPKKINNTFLFYQRGWSGVNIEPNSRKIDLFKKKRKRDLNLNFGIGTSNGELDFYMFNADTLSTFSKEVADDYIKMGHKILDVKKVEILSLKFIFDKYLNGKNIDFLSVDTEGNDLDVLKSNDWVKYRPNFLIVETLEYKEDYSAKKLNDLYDPYLSDLGYGKIAETYINTIYYDKNR